MNGDVETNTEGVPVGNAKDVKRTSRGEESSSGRGEKAQDYGRP